MNLPDLKDLEVLNEQKMNYLIGGVESQEVPDESQGDTKEDSSKKKDVDSEGNDSLKRD